MSEYLKITLLVKPGTGAEWIITDRLNAWFTEVPREAPYPPGTLLHYAIHDETKPVKRESPH